MPERNTSNTKGGHRVTMTAALRLLVDAWPDAPKQVPELIRRAALLIGAEEATAFVCDYTQAVLTPLTTDGSAAEEAAVADQQMPVDGTLAGRAFALGRSYVARSRPGHRLWVPMRDGGERLGVLRFAFADQPTRHTRGDCRTMATLVARLLTTIGSHGDIVERARRRMPMQLAAEVVWNLLPPRTMTTADTTVSAILEPCYDIGGDAFDYALNNGVLHMAIFDAVGHGIYASATTSLAVNAYRNARRTGLNLADTYRSIDKWVSAEHPDRFVTALLLELDTTSGMLRRISAGHPAELLIRDGVMVRSPDAPTAMPLGLARLADEDPGVDQYPLHPGDMLLLYTDGVVEARTGDGEEFGVQRLSGYFTRALADRRPLDETMRRLVQAILAHQYDRLQDDATAVLVCWHPRSEGGADGVRR